MAAQAEYDDEEPPARAEAQAEAEDSAAARSLDRAGRLDLRPRAARRHRHHDVSRGTHPRCRRAGALVGRRLAGSRRARGHDPDPPRGPAQHRGGRAARDGDRAGYARHCFRAAVQQGGIGSAARAVARQRARSRRTAGAAHRRAEGGRGRGAGLREAAPAACRGPRRHARRSSRTHRAACARSRAAP